MNVPRPATLFRIGGLLACGIVALPLMARPLAGDIVEQLRSEGVTDLAHINLAGTRLALAAIPVIIAALFGGAFWVNTRPDTLDRDRHRRRAVALLVLQTLLALTVSDYFFLVAAQAPFVFTPRGAFVWLGAQLAVFVTFVVIASLGGADVAIPEMAGTPVGLAVAVSIVYLAGWQIFAFSVGYLAAGERRSHRDLQLRTRELQATQQMLADSSRLAERTQISRELHDTLGHNLTVLTLNLELASHLTEGRAADAVTKAQTVARLLLADVREVVHAFVRDRDRAIDLHRALTTLVDGAHTPRIHLAVPEALAIHDPETAHAVFRCVQEAITNAVRHARASNLWIDLIYTDTRLEVHIRDDGQGGPAVRVGHGLQGMRDRLEGAGGQLRIETAPGQGFRLDAWIPAMPAAMPAVVPAEREPR